MTSEEFRKLGYQLIDWVADYREHVASKPVMAQVKPGWVKDQFSKAPPELGQPLPQLMDALNEKVMPGVTHWAHPNNYAFFPGNADLSSVLADIVSTGLGVNGITWQACPAITEVEEVMMEWLRQMVGLPETFKGVIQDTASTATLIALLCARERACDYRITQSGFSAIKAPLTAYASQDAHSSIEKAALLAGFGREFIRFIPTDDAHALRVDLLEQALSEDVKAGRVPAAIVATAGTTATTAFDPIDAIAKLAKQHGAWLHVDAAMAGSGMILPELRPLWRGVEEADSILWNPHKWLGAAVDCSVYYVRDKDALVRVMSTNPSYLSSQADGEVTQYRDWGIPLGRRFRALKLWFLIHAHGVEGLRARLRRDRGNAQWFKTQVEQTPEWEVVAPVSLQTVCIRHAPKGMSHAELDAHNEAWAQAINQSGKAYLTTTIVKNMRIVRVSIGAAATEQNHLKALWNAMVEATRAS